MLAEHPPWVGLWIHQDSKSARPKLAGGSLPLPPWPYVCPFYSPSLRFLICKMRFKISHSVGTRVPSGWVRAPGQPQNQMSVSYCLYVWTKGTQNLPLTTEFERQNADGGRRISSTSGMLVKMEDHREWLLSHKIQTPAHGPPGMSDPARSPSQILAGP